LVSTRLHLLSPCFVAMYTRCRRLLIRVDCSILLKFLLPLPEILRSTDHLLILNKLVAEDLLLLWLAPTLVVLVKGHGRLLICERLMNRLLRELLTLVELLLLLREHWLLLLIVEVIRVCLPRLAIELVEAGVRVHVVILLH
jgi:hypothetical protein